MKILNIVLLALLATSCSQSNPFVRAPVDPLISPPNILCEPNEQILYCDSDKLLACQGFILDDRPIDIEEIE
jgi:hypothetical protein